jgi:choline dehydrogenase-like flavoprotein
MVIPLTATALPVRARPWKSPPLAFVYARFPYAFPKRRQAQTRRPCSPDSQIAVILSARHQAGHARPLLVSRFCSFAGSLQRLFQPCRQSVLRCRHIIASPALAPYLGREVWPGQAAQSDEALLAFIRHRFQTTSGLTFVR